MSKLNDILKNSLVVILKMSFEGPVAMPEVVSPFPAFGDRLIV